MSTDATTSVLIFEGQKNTIELSHYITKYFINIMDNESRDEFFVGSTKSLAKGLKIFNDAKRKLQTITITKNKNK
jgi:hypothetical protein